MSHLHLLIGEDSCDVTVPYSDANNHYLFVYLLFILLIQMHCAKYYAPRDNHTGFLLYVIRKTDTWFNMRLPL